MQIDANAAISMAVNHLAQSYGARNSQLEIDLAVTRMERDLLREDNNALQKRLGEALQDPLAEVDGQPEHVPE